MYRLPAILQARLFPALLALCLATPCVYGQSQATPPQSPAAGQPAAPAATDPQQSKADDEMLAKTAQLYYSTARAGLDGFDCAIHPDWGVFINSTDDGSTGPDKDAHIALLNSVKLTLHARLKGGSTLDWVQASDPAKPEDAAANTLLTNMHQATEQTVEGFLQFWTPFVDGSVVPATAQGLEMTHSDGGFTLHAAQGGTELSEIFDRGLVLQHFDVKMSGITIKFTPTYKPTQQGLLVDSFKASILTPDATPGPAKEMHVAVDYQAVDGFPIPSRLAMELTGMGKFDFTFDGCTINRQAK